MQGTEIEGKGAYWSTWLSLNIESNAAVGTYETPLSLDDLINQALIFRAKQAQSWFFFASFFCIKTKKWRKDL